MAVASPVMLGALPGIVYLFFQLAQASFVCSVAHGNWSCSCTAFFKCDVSPLFFDVSGCLQYYRCSSRELKRLDSITASPVFSQFSETIDGLQTIRSFGIEQREIQELLTRKNVNNRMYFASMMANQWIGQRLETLSACTIVAIGCLVVVGKHMNVSWLSGSASLASVAVMYRCVGVVGSLCVLKLWM